MKGKVFVTCLLAVLLCASAFTSSAYKEKAGEQFVRPRVEHIGQIPAELEAVLENNAFERAYAFDGRVLKADLLASDTENRTSTYRVQMLDLYGKELGVCTVTAEGGYHLSTLTGTKDGGFLYVLGFSDYNISPNEWASDKGFASHVIKCDKDGNVEFDRALDGVEGSALRECVEREGNYVFFGTIETPETKIQGIYSPTDVYISVLDQQGEVLKTCFIAGSDYDSLISVKALREGYSLVIDSKSRDGDFACTEAGESYGWWSVSLDEELEITEKSFIAGISPWDRRLGEKDGLPVSTGDDPFRDFDGGYPTAYLDYGEYYLIVSENTIGVLDNPNPYSSTILFQYETVYSGYDHDGALLFRTAVEQRGEEA